MVVQKQQLMMMPFKRLWARMLSMFTAQYPLILRLVAIAMTFTTDTSGCERLISLMNDLQREFQTRMEHDCLRPQMWWSTEMHPLTYSEWQGTRIVDINVTTMHRRLLLKPLRQRQLLDATLSTQVLPAAVQN
jgi:hypothetical protein